MGPHQHRIGGGDVTLRQHHMVGAGDLIPDDPASGGVFFEEVGNLSIITWDAVVGYVGRNAGTTPSTSRKSCVTVRAFQRCAAPAPDGE